ncbi:MULTISPECIES: helix-turn-helix domain-containing protein [Yersinia]|nr:helix-turn-helix domain-containing protein [Yersinia mollaretii]
MSKRDKEIGEKRFPYIAAEKVVFSATSVMNKNTGKLFELTPNDKLTYWWMRDRYSYCKTHKNDYFDNQDKIANDCGIKSETTIRKCIRKLEEIGLIKSEKRKVLYGRSSYKYSVFTLVETQEFLEWKTHSNQSSMAIIASSSKLNSKEGVSEITGNNKLNCSLSSYLIDNIKGMLPIDCFSGSGEVSHTGVAFCEKNGIDTSDSEAMKIYIWRCQYTKKTMTQEQLKSALSMCDKMQSISVSDEPF